VPEPTARLIVLAGAAIGAVVWLLVLARWRALRATQAPPSATVTAARGASLDEVKRGLMELALARQWQCTSREGDALVFALPLGAKLVVLLRRSMSRVEAVIETDLAPLDRRFTRWVGLFVALIPLVVAGLALLLLRLAVPAELAPVRWQSVQIAQVVHVLWPPFLLLFLHQRMRKALLGAASDVALRIETLEPAAADPR
jgi:hypothetical protein